MALELASFDFASTLQGVLTLVREMAMRHGITLGLDIDADLGSIVADERKVRQILLNLLSNAVKFTPDGGRVSLAAKRGNNCVEISVVDTGIGISPQDQALLFEEFRQVGNDSARKHEGTGLGLALAKRFVELHGSTVRVESAPGKGTTFTFSLPDRPPPLG